MTEKNSNYKLFIKELLSSVGAVSYECKDHINGFTLKFKTKKSDEQYTLCWRGESPNGENEIKDCIKDVSINMGLK